jgi:predicted lactoylglutathione lyase
MTRQIFVNLPIKDLNKTKEFFNKLGFTFKPEFTNENAACMIIGENIYAMLLVKKFFQTFTKKNIINAKKDVEVLNAIFLDSRNEVDEMMTKALTAGGIEPRAAQDHGWMYSRAFEDLDGHIWEIGYGDESQMPEEMKNKR